MKQTVEVKKHYCHNSRRVMYVLYINGVAQWSTTDKTEAKAWTGVTK